MGKREKPPAGAPAGTSAGTPAAPFHRPFAGLAGRLGDLPPGPAPSGPARAVVRMERAGRGGKTVTVVEKLDLSPAALAAWSSELKRALGCGGAVDGDAIVLQGDVRDRAGDWLVKRGVRKVTRG